ncbi:uncharacterized protein LOC105847327 [Hydra vulgaris]|uniref:uncharacterized protein LOC105847327 n=1 Tax=Hydra vulgaris TaxID=6087 RepID=UPI001F5EC43C|nr:uncharacterized protein LOC105847327 [Hydra vulgaris]
MEEMEKLLFNCLCEMLDKITELNLHSLKPDTEMTSWDVYRQLSLILKKRAYICYPEKSFICISGCLIKIDTEFDICNEEETKPYVIVTKNVTYENSNDNYFSWVTCVIWKNSNNPIVICNRDEVAFFVGYKTFDRDFFTKVKVTIVAKNNDARNNDARNNSKDFEINFHQNCKYFNNCNQQFRDIDSGFWAIYNALMIVYKKDCIFLNKFQIASITPALNLRTILHKFITYSNLQHISQYLKCNDCKAIIPKNEAIGFKERIFILSEDDLRLNLDDSKFSEEYVYFPRCEYYARYQGTTCFNMKNPNFWGTYFRSTSRGGNSDRYSKTVPTNQKTYNNTAINFSQKRNGGKSTASYHSKTGAFRSPFFDEKYKKIILCQDDCKKITGNVFLYDKILKYKQYLCQSFVTQYNRKPITGIEAIYSNQYPCILVLISCFNNNKDIRSIQSWYKVAMSYYVAITNYNADITNIPIELVVRSSFGHVLPSVDSINNAFRINIGIVPIQYIYVLVTSLSLLGEVLQVLQCHAIDENVIKKQNKKIEDYNSRTKNKKNDELPCWEKKLFVTLNLIGDRSNKGVIAQITRKKSYTDLLIDLVIKELYNRKNCYALPIIEMLKNIIYDQKIYLDKKMQQEFTMLNKRFYNTKIIKDRIFWEFLMDVGKVLDFQNKHLLRHIESQNIYGLYANLEETNVNFICNSGYQNCEDGFGSDSDFDGEDEDLNFYIRKITVSTGMRAINLATFLSLYYITKIPNVTTYRLAARHMYYETENAVDEVINVFSDFSDLFKVPTKEKSKSGSTQENCANICFFDLNFCNSLKLEDNIESLLESCSRNYPIIIDYTSATTEKIRSSVLKCLKNTKVVLLVNSGLKNEQFSADINPYGTLRIIAKERKLMLELYALARGALEMSKEILPSASHQIRKAYKDAGFVVTNKHLFKKKIKKANASEMIETEKIEENIFYVWKLFDYLPEIKELKNSGFNLYQIIECYNCNKLKKMKDQVSELKKANKFEEIEKIKTALYDSYKNKLLN